MKPAGLALAALALLAAPALAQEQRLDGQWHARANVNGSIVDSIVVITGQTYISNQTMVTAQGAQYFVSQSGQVFFTPPNHLGFVVLDWSPKEYLGQPQARPPNSNVAIVTWTATQMVVVDEICVQSQPAEQCQQVFIREQ